MYYSCEKGGIQIVKFLISKGAMINTKCANGNTPVHMAFKSGNKELIYYLHKQGGDINSLNNDNMPPICYGSINLLRDLNLLNGFAVLSQEAVDEELGKEFNRQRSIRDLKKNSLILGKKIQTFFRQQSRVSRKSRHSRKMSFNIPVNIISDDEGPPEQAKPPPQSQPVSRLQSAKMKVRCTKNRKKINTTKNKGRNSGKQKI